MVFFFIFYTATFFVMPNMKLRLYSLSMEHVRQVKLRRPAIDQLAQLLICAGGLDPVQVDVEKGVQKNMASCKNNKFISAGNIQF